MSYVRKCRSILCITEETLASYRLTKPKNWQQLFTDGISRRHTFIQSLIIGIKEDSVLKIIVISSSIVLVGESSEQQYEAISDMIGREIKLLERSYRKQISTV